MMISNYLKVAWRNIRRQKMMSFINIFSLALGIAACLLIFLFIREEQSFDAFHSKRDHIYRLDEIQSFPGTNTQNVALSMPGMGPALAADYPEVQNFTRYYTRGKRLYRKDAREFIIDESVMVDSSFLEIFDFPLLSGDPGTALDEPFTIIISESTARKFFKGIEVVGETLKMGDRDFTIKGVLKDVPENSHLQFDILISMATALQDNPEFNQQFGSNFLNTYLLIDPKADLASLEEQMPEFLLRVMPPDPGDTEDVTDYYQLFFQKLTDVHLASMDIEHDYNNHRKFNGKYLGVFAWVGLFIILIASINFMNLITARAAHRRKEVGVRKTIGALRSQLFSQFVTESVLLGGLAFLIGILMAVIAAPLLSGLIDRNLSMQYFLDHPGLLAVSLGITLLLGFLAGIYPAYYLSSFQVSKVIKGDESPHRHSLFRNGLVVLQFGLAIAMIVSTLVVIQQLMYIQNKDIGINKDHILLVDMNSDANEVFTTLKQELKRGANIRGVTASGQRLGNNFHQWGFKLKTDSVRGMTPSNVNVDYDYLEVYEIDLIHGRAFDSERPRDKDYAFIINESFQKELGLDEPLGVAAGHSWYPDDSLGTIIGVVKDFNFNSLHYPINTLSMVVHPEWGYDELSVKVDGNNIEAAIAYTQQVWNRLVPEWPFQYSFLDEHFDDMYRSDQQMGVVVKIMAILAILIACLGLFGLASINTEQRLKEVGIRKVLGASVQQITMHLSRRFAWLVVVAFVLFALPTYLLMNTWLTNFAERISVGIPVFIVGFILAFLVAMLTVGYHTVKAAYANPVDAIRDE